jgi:hypothetical protein
VGLNQKKAETSAGTILACLTGTSLHDQPAARAWRISLVLASLDRPRLGTEWGIKPRIVRASDPDHFAARGVAVSEPSPKGGASTINGVVYQMLWSLLRVGAMHASAELDPSTGEVTTATLILEPATGGDLQGVAAGVRTIEQIKARTTSRPWSVRDLVHEVLPDLYRSVDLSLPASVFRFVTEAECRNWSVFQDFIDSLPRDDSEGDILDRLEPTRAIRVWRDGPASEKELFGYIVQLLRQRPQVASEPSETTRRKALHLLKRFEFDGNRGSLGLTAGIDAWLDGLVPALESKTTIRDALLMELVRRATTGSARITAQELLESRGLTATPLGDWRAHWTAARALTERALCIRRYDPKSDVRPAVAAAAAPRWPSSAPVLVLTGESGVGKTWSGYALLSELTAQGQVALLVPSEGDATRDLAAASAAFWQGVVGNDNPVPLERVRARLGKVLAARPLYFLFDGVSDHKEARDLAYKPWEDWGFYPILTCSADVAKTVEAAARERCRVLEVPKFSTSELQRLLRRVDGIDWPRIPSGIRDTLRLPLHASIYTEIASPGGWLPAREYELYERLWQRLYEGEQGRFPSDADMLRSAAFSLLRGADYPWTELDLGPSDERDSRAGRLARCGWLRSPRPGVYEIPHDRLLNWAVAEGAVRALETGHLSQQDLGELLRELNSEDHPQRQRFGYVTLDVLWLLGDPQRRQDSVVGGILSVLEEADLGEHDALYARLVPTLGSRMLPSTFARLRDLAHTEDVLLVGSLVRGIASVEDDAVHRHALEQLDEPSPRLRRMAARLLTHKPTPAALTKLWRLHCDQSADPTPFQQEWERGRVYRVYQDTFEALRASVALNPEWLLEAIATTDASSEPVHDLAYLVAGLNDGGAIWMRVKETLFKKVVPLRARSLATNIQTHRDLAELDWLVERVSEAKDLLGPVALRALAHLDPDLALMNLERLPVSELYSTRAWTLGELLLRRPAATRAWLLDRLRRESRPWDFARCLQGLENEMGPIVLELLLEELPSLAAEDLAEQGPSDRLSCLFHPLNQLMDVTRPELLECLRGQRGLPLARALSTWLTARGPQEGAWRQDEKHNAFALLARIGGDEFTGVLNQWIGAADRHARLQGYQIAERHAPESTVRVLMEASNRTDLWDDSPVEQGYAARALAAAGQWRGVIAYISRVGLGALRAVTEHRFEAGRLDDAAMAPAFEDLDREGMTPGVIMALGFGGRTEYLPAIHDALRGAPLGDVGAAGAIALTWLRDSTPAVSESVRVLLSDARQARHAVAALFENGSDEAVELLFAYFQENYDDLLAVDLLHDPRSRKRVAEIVSNRLRASRPWERLSTLDALLTWSDEPTLIDELLRESEVENLLLDQAFGEEGSSWLSTRKATAIRALARLDPETAFEAAQAALADSEAQDREPYPYVLVSIDAQEAMARLLERAQVERSTSVIWAMARAMDRTDYPAALQAAFDSGSANARRAACRLAARMKPEAWVSNRVTACLEDRDQEVALAAHAAMAWLREGEAALALSAALQKETDPLHRWTILEALLKTGDPGDDGQVRPAWATEARKILPLAMRRYLDEGLRKRRKEMLDLARKADKE